jgi:hypothetical protein
MPDETWLSPFDRNERFAPGSGMVRKPKLAVFQGANDDQIDGRLEASGQPWCLIGGLATPVFRILAAGCTFRASKPTDCVLQRSTE